MVYGPPLRENPAPLSLWQGFSALALLTFWTGWIFVQETVTCIVRCWAALRDVKNTAVVATKDVATYRPKFPKARSPWFWTTGQEEQSLFVGDKYLLVRSVKAGVTCPAPLTADREGTGYICLNTKVSSSKCVCSRGKGLVWLESLTPRIVPCIQLLHNKWML